MADKIAIEEIKIPSIVLMENAARGFVDELLNIGIDKGSFAVIAGSGNNGGDGLAIARHLYNRGFYVEIFFTESEEKFSKDLKVNYEIIRRYPIKICSINEFEDRFDYIIDAILGTGLNRALEGRYKEIVQMLNRTKSRKVAVDIPSGLSGSDPNIIGEAIKADFTITFCRPKIPHVIYPARDFCGDVRIIDISIPDFIIPKVGPYLFLLNEKTVPAIPKRRKFSHKGDYGHAVLLGGSIGKSGAITIATYSTIKTGAGLTTTILPEAIYQSLSSFIPEAMYFTLQDYDNLSDEAIEGIINFISDKTVVAIGPGMGVSEGRKKLISKIMENKDIKIVFDADGINNLKGISFDSLKYRTIITPHIGEFCRLIGITKEDLIKDLIKYARDFAIFNGVVLVLKSSSTLIALPDGNVYVYSGGVPALAKGGSGDCLVGIITAFVAQGFSLRDASLLGVYLFGETGKYLSNRKNEMTITATEIIENIGKVLDDLQDIEY